MTKVIKPTLPKGTRDFSPEIMNRRNEIFNTIKAVFKKFAFNPIETPAMENIETLTGKYGEEGDQLIYKIRSNRNVFQTYPHLENEMKRILKDELQLHYNFLPHASELALRYDLTVPFARFVVQNRNNLSFPFRRYQIQPVWRADKPQKGRYREFYQCDADIIGSPSLLNETDLILLSTEVFKNLGIQITFKINNRKILQGFASYAGHPDKLNDLAIAIDKLEKTSLDLVIEEIKSKGFDDDAVQKIKPLLEFKPDYNFNEDSVSNLLNLCKHQNDVKMGLDELLFVWNKTKEVSENTVQLQFDLSLARGLNYYTGCIFEIKVNDPNSNFTGSIGGGGRYDDLTGIFGMNGVSGVGISFGADRIYDVMEELNLFKTEKTYPFTVLMLNMGEQMENYALNMLAKLRRFNIDSMIYPDRVKIKKQMEYASKLNIPYVGIIGEDEIEKNVFTLKNMHKGEQVSLSESDFINRIKSGI